jgi:hypothetical protein
MKDEDAKLRQPKDFILEIFQIRTFIYLFENVNNIMIFYYT